MAPGVPEGSIFAGFEGNEIVNLYNANLMITHPSSLTYPLNGGGSVGLSRVYNSMNVVDRQITLSVLAPDEKKSLLSGKSWVGYGWKMHLGRIFIESIERKGIAGVNPGCVGEGYDPCYQEFEFFFESPDGTKTRFASTDPNGGQSLTGNNDPFAPNEVNRELKSGQDHPVLRVRYFKAAGEDCEKHLSSGRPLWCDARGGTLPAECGHYGRFCQASGEAKGYYLVELEDGTELRLEKMNDADRNARKFIRNASNQGWYPTRIRYPGKTPGGDTVLNITYHQQACRDAGWSGCDDLYPYGEAIKEITSPTHPDIHIWTDVWSSSDVYTPGYVANTRGMLKAIHSTGQGGQQVTYRYFYADEQDELDTGLEHVALLTKVEIPSPGQATPYSIQYSYRTGFDPIFMDLPGTGFLLEQITYPLGGQSYYAYGEFACGAKKACSPRGPCNEVGYFNMHDRRCRGVIRRDLKPEGTTGPAATSYWKRRWTATRCGEDDPSADIGVQNRYAFVGADRRHQVSELVLNPCREAVTQSPNVAMSGRFAFERTYDAADETAVLRTKEYDYTMETGVSAPKSQRRPIGRTPAGFRSQDHRNLQR
ncbi:MAG: hypothetical protein U0V87_17995 [Acidobacteriota bacterium]